MAESIRDVCVLAQLLAVCVSQIAVDYSQGKYSIIHDPFHYLKLVYMYCWVIYNNGMHHLKKMGRMWQLPKPMLTYYQ